MIGLAPAIATTDLSLAHHATAGVEAATVWINGYVHFSSGLAFGGHRRSGIDGACRAEILDEYRQQ